MCRPYSAVPLPLTGVQNLRDLGGYQTGEGKTLRFHQLLRSDAPVALTPEDVDFLRRYGLRCTIDLRSRMEAEHFPSRLRECPGVEYCHLPLRDGVHDGDGGFPASLGELYKELLDHAQETLAEIFRRILSYPEDCVLFHCTAGKDRTGVVAMLLLKLCGVSDEDVVRDYTLTETYLPFRPSIQTEAERFTGRKLPVHVFRSEPENMRAALAHLARRYQGAASYLLGIGLREEELEALRKKLLDS